MERFFKLDNCRVKLYQWDINQKLIILDDTITEVQYENKNFVRSISQNVYEKDGVRLCDIPKVLLEQADNITVYAYIRQANSGYTKVFDTIEVVGRKRPNNYYAQFPPKEP